MLNDAQARHERNQVFPIFLTHGREFQTHALADSGVLDGRLSADRPLLHEEVQIGRGTDSLGSLSFEKDATDA